MSAQMRSSFPVTSHLFMSYLVLLPFPCESLGLNLNADQEASLSSHLDNFCLYSSQPLLSLPIHAWGTRPCASPVLRQCPLSSFSLSSLHCLPLKPTSPPVLRSCSVLPYHSAAPASPWLLNRPWFLPPFSVLSFSQSSSLLTSIMGFAPFLLLLRSLVCHILSSVSCLTSAVRAACCLPCQAQPGLLVKGSLSLFSCTPGLGGRRHQLTSARWGNRGRFTAVASDLPCTPSAAAVSSFLTFC